MSIQTRDDYLAAKKQRVVINRTASIAATAFNQTQNFHAAGNPGAGTLAGASVANGVIQTDSIAGFPSIRAFDVGATGHLTRVEAYSPVAVDLLIADLLWKAGPFPFNANQAVASPSWASRVPLGTDFAGLELWAEAVTAFTGIPAITVSYADQGGVASSIGPVSAPAAIGIARMFQLPLASGDNGIQSITNVLSATATAGTYNLLVLRPLLRFRLAANESKILTLADTGGPEVWENSALVALPTPDSTATSTPYVALEIANK